MRLIDSLARRFVRQTLDGYEQAELVELIFKKTQAYVPQGEWPEIAGARTVLDFGGGCGAHYKQAKSPQVRWAVVETPAMVERARECATNNLRFFADISEAKSWLGDIDVMHSNGALQYTPNPELVLRQLCDLRASKMLWYRVLLGEPEHKIESSFLGDSGPGDLRVKEKIVRLERSRIPERIFLEAHAGYGVTARGADWFCFAVT